MAIQLPIIRTMKRLNADYIDRAALEWELEKLRQDADAKHARAMELKNDTEADYWAGVNDGAIAAMERADEC